jgi:hypothetical protein
LIKKRDNKIKECLIKSAKIISKKGHMILFTICLNPDPETILFSDPDQAPQHCKKIPYANARKVREKRA